MDLDPKRLAAFAERVRLGRQRLFPTRLAFCREARITRTTLRHLESGSQQPTQETIEKLAKALQITPRDLVGEDRIDPDSPLLKDLREEDFEVAQLFHHASTDLRLRVRALLRGTPVPVSDPSDPFAPLLDRLRRRLAVVPGDARAIMEYLDTLETFGTPSATVAKKTKSSAPPRRA
ncbi:MAG TPA: helix-turn-helix transcriptional regulator [Gaiellaceae bacterium]|nr:helix-turn-helix transcriptional regulator [Gaiellaceae bacterium]